MNNEQKFPWIAISLAVIAIALGAGFLWPIHSGGHSPAPKSECRSNLKQLALSFILYKEDWDGLYPNRDFWMDATKPYMKQREDEYHCPSLREEGRHVYGYAFNRDLSEAKEPKDPANVALVFDSINLARNASGALDSLPSPGRHGGSNNIAYADGHAKAEPGKPSSP